MNACLLGVGTQPLKFIDFSGQIENAKLTLARQVMENAKWAHRQGDLCAFRLYDTPVVKISGSARSVDAELCVSLTGGHEGYSARLYVDGQLVLESADRRMRKSHSDKRIQKLLESAGPRLEAAWELHEYAQKLFGLDLRDFYQQIYPVNVHKKSPRTILAVTFILLILAVFILLVTITRMHG